MTALVSALLEPSVLIALTHLATEFLLTDVALSTLGVPSFTIASLDLLSDVLDGHAPSVIVTSQQSLYMVLEQIEEGSDSTTHTIIVVGGLPSRPPKCRTRLIDFADVEAHGWTAEKVQLPTPSKPFHPVHWLSTHLITRLHRTQRRLLRLILPRRTWRTSRCPAHSRKHDRWRRVHPRSRASVERNLNTGHPRLVAQPQHALRPRHSVHCCVRRS